MAQCSGKHISAMQLFYELKQRFPHIPDRLVNHCIKQAQGDKEACWCMLESEKPRMSEPSLHRREISSAPPSPARERPRGPPVVRNIDMPPSFLQGRPDECFSYNTLIRRQLEGKRNLEIELQKEKKRLTEMQKREKELLYELNARIAACNMSVKARALTQEISLLQSECSQLSNELESLDEMGDAEDELCWCCHMCTFRNHHLLRQCEYCTMPRVTLEGGETQNIHIRVTHHNFPSCNCFYPEYDICDFDTQ